MMFEKILVALDTDDRYSHIFESALALAKASGATLDLLSVLTPARGAAIPLSYYSGTTSYPLTMDETFWSTYEEEQRKYDERVNSLLSHLLTEAQAMGIQADFVQISGDPGRVICDRAKTEKVDLIMVGSHGRRGLGEFLAGSVSSYVMHRAPCSVMIVREGKPSQPLSEPTSQMSSEAMAETTVEEMADTSAA
ncbi:MAG: universal stress protein [Phormidesmis sp. RL_2_1]|nr:universal stress protein [Phormidesmis sp. RL_2_1]